MPGHRPPDRGRRDQQRLGIGRVERADRVQPRQRLARGGAGNVRVRRGVDELQRLGDKFHLHHAARRMLHVPRPLRRKLARRRARIAAASARTRAGGGPLAMARAIAPAHARPAPAARPRRGRGSAPCAPRSRRRHVPPSAPGRGSARTRRARPRPGLCCRTGAAACPPHTSARSHRGRERGDEGVHGANEPLARRQAARAAALRDAGRMVVDQHQVEVGAGHHLPPAGLAEQHHRQSAAAHAAVAFGEIREHPREQGGIAASATPRARIPPASASSRALHGRDARWRNPPRARCARMIVDRVLQRSRASRQPRAQQARDVRLLLRRQQPLERRGCARQVVGERAARRRARRRSAPADAGLRWNSDSNCTPVGSRPRNASKRAKAASGLRLARQSARAACGSIASISSREPLRAQGARPAGLPAAHRRDDRDRGCRSPWRAARRAVGRRRVAGPRKSSAAASPSQAVRAPPRRRRPIAGLHARQVAQQDGGERRGSA